MIQLASVRVRSKRVVVESRSVTDQGFATGNGWYVSGDEGTLTDDQLGAWVREALDRSEWHIPAPALNRSEPYLAEFGVKTTNQFAKGCLSTSVDRDAGVITASAMRYVGRGGFESTNSMFRATCPAGADDATIGDIVRQAIAHSS